MKIIYHSVPAGHKTGYGVQTKLFTKALKDAGHDVVISSIVAGSGNYHDENGILTLSAGTRGNMGNDFIQAHVKDHKPDMLLSMFDTHIASCDKFIKLPWVAWQVVDSIPIVPKLVKPCHTAKLNLAMSRFGQGVMKDAGIESEYVPLAYDGSDYFMMDDRAEARQNISDYFNIELGNRFLAVMNSANMSQPSRKNFGAAFKAFRMYLDNYDSSALLYVHTEKTGKMNNGENLADAVKMYGLTEGENIIFAEQYKYNMGLIAPEVLRNIYNAADVFLHTAKGEGFGLPIVEAQACGCPVIVPDATAMTELREQGFWICEGIWQMYYPGTEWFFVNPECVPAILSASAAVKDKKRRPTCQKYEIGNVYENYLKPVLDKIESGEIAI